MFRKTSLFVLSSLQLLFWFNPATGLRCYQGTGDVYYERECEAFEIGQQWFCAKVPDFQGQEARSCFPNPLQALSTGCYEYPYLGQTVEICFCDTNLCNSARKSTSTILIPLILSAGLVWWSRNFIKA